MSGREPITWAFTAASQGGHQQDAGKESGVGTPFQNLTWDVGHPSYVLNLH